MESKANKIEQVGVQFEKMGYSPMAGRVFAFLLLAEPPQKSFDEIREFLQASKSAVSNALRLLGDYGIVEYTTFRGDRKRYFFINTEKWLERMKFSYKERENSHLLLKSILDERSDKHVEFNQGLHKNLEFHEYMTKGIKNLLENWEKN